MIESSSRLGALTSMRIGSIPLRVAALGAVAAAGTVYGAYRRAVDASLARVSAGSRVANSSRGRIEYAEAGSGPAVLVVHGGGGGYDHGMAFAMPLVQPGLRVIAMSRFGYLRTPLPNDASSTAQADAHAALLDALSIDSAAIIGVSEGASSAMEFAVRHRRRCAALVLVAPLMWLPQTQHSRFLRDARRNARRLATPIAPDFVVWCLSQFRRDLLIRHVLGTPPRLLERAAVDEKARVNAMIDAILPLRSRRQGLWNDAIVAGTHSAFDLHGISVPTLVAGFRDDGFGTYAAARYIAQRIPGARFVGYDEGGHVGLGHYDVLMREIDRFLVGSAIAARSAAAHAA